MFWLIILLSLVLALLLIVLILGTLFSSRDRRVIRMRIVLWWHRNYPYVYFFIIIAICVGTIVDAALTDMAFIDAQLAIETEIEAKRLLQEVSTTETVIPKDTSSDSFMGVSYRRWVKVIIGTVVVIVVGLSICYAWHWFFGVAANVPRPPFIGEEMVELAHWGLVPTADTINNISSSRLNEYLSWVLANNAIKHNDVIANSVIQLNQRCLELGVHNVNVQASCAKHLLRLIIHEGMSPAQAVLRVTQYL